VSARGGQASTLSSVCVLTDHPLIPHMTSKLKLFTGGFVIEQSDAGNTFKIESTSFMIFSIGINKFNPFLKLLSILQNIPAVSLPILISFEHHVAELWTIDASECLTIAQSRGFIRNPPSGPESELRGLPAPQAPDGLLIIIRVNEFRDCECDTTADIDASNTSQHESEAEEDDNDDDDDDTNVGRRGGGSRRVKNTTSVTQIDRVRKSMMFNPLKRSLSPFCSPSSSSSTINIFEPVCVAIFAPRGSKISAALGSPLLTWRSTLRSKGLPEHRGRRGEVDVSEGEAGFVPSSVLKAFIAAIDSYSIADCSSNGSGFGVSTDSAVTGMEDMIWDESTVATSSTVCAAGRKLSGLPGTGFLAMRYF
jgi:hypothetical protein